MKNRVKNIQNAGYNGACTVIQIELKFYNYYGFHPNIWYPYTFEKQYGATNHFIFISTKISKVCSSNNKKTQQK